MGFYDSLDSFPNQRKRTWPEAFEDIGGTWPNAVSHPNSVSELEISSSTTPAYQAEYVCFGSIAGIKAQLQQVDRRVLSQGLHVEHTLYFSITREGTYFALMYSSSKIARLNKHACRLLNSLSINEQVSFSAALDKAEWRVALKSYENHHQDVLSFELAIYGLKQDADQIGSILSKEHIYLQFPRHDYNAEYYNPHFFRIKGYSDQFLPIEGSKSGRDVQTITSNTFSSEDTKTSDAAVVDSILDSLAHHVDIGSVSVDGRIRRSLLPHQKEAIDFISRRELGQSLHDVSLWKYNDEDDEEPFYQHTFTGAKRPEKTEEKGGIIADEMGLGKSLVTLTTIVGSLDRAKKFSCTENGGSNIESNTKPRTQATLVVAPSSLLIDSWVDEIRKHTYPGALSFHKHLGSSRHAEKNMLQHSMIVFTTYATVATEFCRGNTSLAQLHWFRVVLDEAHEIRNKSTKQFQAVSSLTAEHRWCLTGTPIQNSLEDLGALTTFLKVPILENAPTFRKFITAPIMTGSKNRFQNLQLLLQAICLRRTRELLNLPEPISYTRELEFTPSERHEYNDLLRQGSLDIDMVVSGRRKGRINSTVLESLLKVRLYCNNGITSSAPTLAVNDKGLPVDPDEALTYLQQLGCDTCTYCHGTIYSLNDARDTEGALLLPACQHIICSSCRPLHRAQKEQCPGCSRGDGSAFPLWELDSRRRQSQQVKRTQYRTSYPTKLLTLVNDISREVYKKSIVFSSWKKSLNLLGELFANKSIRYNMIDGSLPLSERIKVLKDFRSDSGASILLMTLGTGAVGLNLAVASRIYLLEPQWNPSIESQAIGRALRIGQDSQVVVIRYIMKDTVEQSNVLSRQRTKLRLAGGGFGKTKEKSSEQLQAMLNVFGVCLESRT